MILLSMILPFKKNFHSTHFFIEPLADFDILRREMKSKTYSFNDRKPAPDLNV
jgi:hypothetical protein